MKTNQSSSVMRFLKVNVIPKWVRYLIVFGNSATSVWAWGSSADWETRLGLLMFFIIAGTIAAVEWGTIAVINWDTFTQLDNDRQKAMAQEKGDKFETPSSWIPIIKWGALLMTCLASVIYIIYTDTNKNRAESMKTAQYERANTDYTGANGTLQSLEANLAVAKKGLPIADTQGLYDKKARLEALLKGELSPRYADGGYVYKTRRGEVSLEIAAVDAEIAHFVNSDLPNRIAAAAAKRDGLALNVDRIATGGAVSANESGLHLTAAMCAASLGGSIMGWMLTLAVLFSLLVGGMVLFIGTVDGTQRYFDSLDDEARTDKIRRQKISDCKIRTNGEHRFIEGVCAHCGAEQDFLDQHTPQQAPAAAQNQPSPPHIGLSGKLLMDVGVEEAIQSGEATWADVEIYRNPGESFPRARFKARPAAPQQTTFTANSQGNVAPAAPAFATARKAGYQSPDFTSQVIGDPPMQPIMAQAGTGSVNTLDPGAFAGAFAAALAPYLSNHTAGATQTGEAIGGPQDRRTLLAEYLRRAERVVGRMGANGKPIALDAKAEWNQPTAKTGLLFSAEWMENTMPYPQILTRSLRNDIVLKGILVNTTQAPMLAGRFKTSDGLYSVEMAIEEVLKNG